MGPYATYLVLCSWYIKPFQKFYQVTLQRLLFQPLDESHMGQHHNLHSVTIDSTHFIFFPWLLNNHPHSSHHNNLTNCSGRSPPSWWWWIRFYCKVLPLFGVGGCQKWHLLSCLGSLGNTNLIASSTMMTTHEDSILCCAVIVIGRSRWCFVLKTISGLMISVTC